MVHGYIRVSTDKQTVENQRFEINRFCEQKNLIVDCWIEETISGMKTYDKRALGSLLKNTAKRLYVFLDFASRWLYHYSIQLDVYHMEVTLWKNSL